MSNTKKIILTVQDLSKNKMINKGVRREINQISFTLKEDTIMAVVGEKRSGKSTMTKVLSRVITDFSGVIKLQDLIISGKKIDKVTNQTFQQKVQLMPSDPFSALNPAISIYKNLSFQLKATDSVKKMLSDIEKDYKFLIETYGLEFQVKILQLQIKFYESVNKLIGEKLISINYDTLQEKTDKFENASDAYNHLIHEYENTIFDIYHKINDKLIDTKEKLWEYFVERQSDYRESVFSDEENDFHDSMYEFANTIRKSKYSTEYIDAEDKIKKLYESLNQINKTTSKKLISNKHIIKSLMVDINIEINRFKSLFLSSSTNEKYNTYWIHYQVFKIFKSISSKLSIRTLSFLNSWEITTIKNSLNDISLKMISSLITSNFSFEEKMITDNQLYKEQIIDAINHEVTSLIVTFARKSISEKSNISKKIEKIKLDIEKYDQILNDGKEFARKTSISNDELEAAKDKYDKNTKSYNYYYIIRAEKLKQVIMTFTERANAAKKHFENNFVQSIEKYDEFFIKNIKISLNTLKNKLVNYRNYSAKALRMGVVDFKNNPSEFKDKKIYEKIVEQIENGNFSNKQRLMNIKYHFTKYIQAKNGFNTILKMKNNYVIDFEIKRQNVLTIESLLTGVEIKKHKKELENLVEKIVIYQALNDVGLPREYVDRFPSSLTKLEIKKISIAKALVTNPIVLISDDPFSGFDSLSQGVIMNLLKNISKKRGISHLFTTNNIAFAEKFADEVLIMNNGKIIEMGDHDKIFTNKMHPFTRQLFDSQLSLEKNEVLMSEEDYFFLSMPAYSFGMGKTPIYYEIDQNHFVYGKKENIAKWLENYKMDFNEKNIVGDHIFDRKKIEIDTFEIKGIEEESSVKELFDKFSNYKLPYQIKVIENISVNDDSIIFDEFIDYYQMTFENNNQITVDELKNGLKKIEEYRKQKQLDINQILKWLRTEGSVNLKEYSQIQRNIFDFVNDEIEKLKDENITHLKSDVV